MKLNNKKVRTLVNILNFGIFILLIMMILMYYDIISLHTEFEEIYVATFLMITTCYIAIRGWQYYEFDTSGEGLTVNVERIDFLSFLGTKQKRIDLPKYKINNYKISKGLLNDDLILFINSKKGKANLVKVKFRISFLSDQQRNIMISELDKIVTTNQYQLD